MTTTKTVTILTVRRPGGTEEEIVKDGTLPEHLIAKMTDATRKAGKGEIINVVFSKIACEIKINDADRATMASEAVERAMTLNGRTF